MKKDLNTLIILAAGTGTRLRPLTESTPKGMVQLGGRSMVKMLLGHFNNWADQIVIVTGYRSDKIEEFVRNTEFAMPVHLVHNDKFEVTNSLYSASLTRDFWAMSREIVFTNSDVVFRENALRAFLDNDRSIVLSVDEKTCDKEDMKVSKHAQTNHITQVSKDIPLDQSFGEFTGVSKMDGAGIEAFGMMVDNMLLEEKMKRSGWYDLVFDRIAQDEMLVDYVVLPDNSYREIDTLEDLSEAKETVEFHWK